jgi:hypothetical protein
MNIEIKVWIFSIGFSIYIYHYPIENIHATILNMFHLARTDETWEKTPSNSSMIFSATFIRFRDFPAMFDYPKNTY